MDAAEDRMLEKWEQSGESAGAQPGPLLGGHRNGFPSCAAGLLARSRSESAFPLSSSAVALSGLAIMEHTAAGLHGILTRFPFHCAPKEAQTAMMMQIYEKTCIVKKKWFENQPNGI